jgi:hypothetical protein
MSSAVLRVGDVLQPIDRLSIGLFLDGDMRHGCVGQGPVPMFLARRELHHIAGADFFDRAALSLHPTAPGRDNQGLP